MGHALLALLVGVIALPLAARWSFLVNGLAWLSGDPAVYAVTALHEESAHRFLFLLLFAVAAALLWSSDRWLAAAVGLVGLQTFAMGPRVVSAYFLIGVGCVSLARLARREQRERIMRWLGYSGLAQAVLILVQWKLGISALMGTFGINGLAACWMAVTGMFAPGWALPIIATGIYFTGSRAGVIAFVIGMGVRYAPAFPVVVACLTILAVCALAWSFWTSEKVSGSARLAVHRLMLADWARHPGTLLMGTGLGAWNQRVVDVQNLAAARGLETRDMLIPRDNVPQHRYFTAAHNDAVQWVYETGALGAVLLAGWFVRWRRRLASPPLSPAFAVIAVMALAWFPLYDLRTGMLTALLIGVGTSTFAEGA